VAKTKAVGKTSQKTARPGKRLGLKLASGQKTKNGAIIVRQRGTLYFPGDGAEMGRDFTIFSSRKGTVKFFTRRGKKFVGVF